MRTDRQYRQCYQQSGILCVLSAGRWACVLTAWACMAQSRQRHKQRRSWGYKEALEGMGVSRWEPVEDQEKDGFLGVNRVYCWSREVWGDFRHKSIEVRFHKLNRNKFLHKYWQTMLPCLNINMFNQPWIPETTDLLSKGMKTKNT